MQKIRLVGVGVSQLRETDKRQIFYYRFFMTILIFNFLEWKMQRS